MRKVMLHPAKPAWRAIEASYDPRLPKIRIPRKVLKGGSHLCAPNYCRRYRRPRVMPSPSTHRRATSDFVVLLREGNVMKTKDADDRSANLNRRNILLGGTTLAAASAIGSAAQAQVAQAQQLTAPRPQAEYSCHVGRRHWSDQSQLLADGLMGYETPHIDRIAHEGLRFLHYYGEQSCTAGRAAFLTGQHGIRSGLTKVGFPGAPMGMNQLDPSIGGLLKSLGYATGQFGKNHVGDRNPSLPTVNGFDEFFGNLYHLNAEEEPELPDYPKDPAYKAKFGPRGVLKCKASDKDDKTVDPRFGKVGKQTIEDTGALTKKRMETIDDETSAAAIDFITRQVEGREAVFHVVQCHAHALAHARSRRDIAAVTSMATASTSTA